MAKNVSNGKKPGIWMEAGVIDFKICKNSFDCTNCEFDRAMNETARRNLALRRAGETPTGKKGKVIHWQDKMRQRSGLEQQCRHMITGRVPAYFCGNNYLCHKCSFDQLLEGQMGFFIAPERPIVEAVNPKVRQRTSLAHDDPYGEGWLFVVTPTNLKPDLENMLFGQRNVAWIENESHKLLGMLESTAGITLPSGGAIIDDVYGHYPQLGWQRLVTEFLHTA